MLPTTRIRSAPAHAKTFRPSTHPRSSTGGPARRSCPTPAPRPAATRPRSSPCAATGCRGKSTARGCNDHPAFADMNFIHAELSGLAVAPSAASRFVGVRSVAALAPLAPRGASYSGTLARAPAVTAPARWTPALGAACSPHGTGAAGARAATAVGPMGPSLQSSVLGGTAPLESRSPPLLPAWKAGHGQPALSHDACTVVHRAAARPKATQPLECTQQPSCLSHSHPAPARPSTGKDAQRCRYPRVNCHTPATWHGTHQSSCGVDCLCCGGTTAGTYSTSRVLSCGWGMWQPGTQGHEKKE